jgi:hypothetical protein
MSAIERGPSFFKKGGLLTPLGPGLVHTECGKNPDGSWYISIKGQREQFEQRSIMTPLQAFNLAIGILRVQGYALQEVKPPDA